MDILIHVYFIPNFLNMQHVKTKIFTAYNGEIVKTSDKIRILQIGQ